MVTRFTVWFTLLALMLINLGTPTLAASPTGVLSQQANGETIYLPVVATTPKPSVRVLSHRSYVEEGSLYIVGEVINELSIPVYAVELEATLYNAAGQVITTEPGSALLEQTRPGQRNPFFLFVMDTPSVARYEVRVVGWQTSSPYAVQPLTIVSQQTRDNMGPEIFGEVSNTTASVLQSTLVVATLYDTAGNVDDVLFDYPGKEVLRPGERSIYLLNAYDQVAAARTTVQGEAFVAPSTTRVPSLRVLSQRSYNYDAQGYRYIVGEVINDSSFTAYRLSIEAKFFNSANQLIAVAKSNGLLEQTRSGQRTPFYLPLDSPPPGVARYELAVSGSSVTDLDYRPLTVVSRQIRNNSGIEVYGAVSNDAPVTLQYPFVAATFYDSRGQVVEVGWGWAEADILEPGARSDYSAPTFATFSYSSYTVQGEGFVEPAMPLAQDRSTVLHQRKAIQRDPRRQPDTTPEHIRTPKAAVR
jgi:hypothetical protein